MAEFLNQKKEPEIDAMNAMGKPIPPKAREAGYETCKEMGLNQAQAWECTQAVSEQLERDQPYEAMAKGMQFLDLTGTYRLFAVILASAASNPLQ